MNEHQLKSEAYSLVLHRLKAKRDADYIMDAIVRMAQAYADAQVEASVARQQPIFEAAMNAKNAEIAELKAIFSKILALPDDTSAAYIKALIHDQLETK